MPSKPRSGACAPTVPQAAGFGRGRTGGGARFPADADAVSVEQACHDGRPFKRNGRSDDESGQGDQVNLSTLLLQGEDMINRLASAHASWGLGSAARVSTGREHSPSLKRDGVAGMPARDPWHERKT